MKKRNHRQNYIWTVEDYRTGKTHVFFSKRSALALRYRDTCRYGGVIKRYN